MIGKAIKTIIRGNTAINAIIEDRLFPISDEETGYPAIFYTVEVIPYYNKNNITSQFNTFKVKLLCMTQNYDQAWSLAVMCKTAIETKSRATVEGIKFHSAQCTRIADDYEFSIETYTTITEFEIKTDNTIT